MRGKVVRGKVVWETVVRGNEMRQEERCPWLCSLSHHQYEKHCSNQKKYCQNGAELYFGPLRLSRRKVCCWVARLTGRLPIAAITAC